MIKKEIIIGIIILLFIIGLIIYFKESEKFENIQTTSVRPVKNTTSSTPFFPSYWYKYDTSDTRSKCFDCDATSKYRHGVPCFDCEIPGGRSIDKNLNRVLTR